MNTLSENDWKKQHMEFHKEFRLRYSEKRRTPGEWNFTFSWPPKNEDKRG